MNTYIDLEEYGRLSSTYEYLFDQGYLSSIIYTEYNERGQESLQHVIGTVSPTKVLRETTILGKNEPVYTYIPYFNTDLRDYDKSASFSDVVFYSARNATEKTEDEYKVKHPSKDIELWIDNRYVCIYKKVNDEFETYLIGSSGQADYTNVYERIKLTSFGVIYDTIEGRDRSITAVRSNSETNIDYRLEKNRAIDLLEYWYDTGSKCVNDTYWIEQDPKTGIITRVTDGSDAWFSRYEEREGYDGSLTCGVIYPSLISKNVEDYQYEFMKLWCKDRAQIDKNDEFTYFKREVYLIDRSDSVIRKLAANPTIPCVI